MSTQVFADNFGGGSVNGLLSQYGNNWVVDTTTGGVPTIAGGQLSVGSSVGATIVHNTGVSLASGRITGSLLLLTGTGVAVLFRFADATHFYGFAFGFSSGNFKCDFSLANGTTFNVLQSATVALTGTPGIPFDYDITFTGSTFACKINGTLVNTATDSTLTAAGAIGFRNGEPTAGARLTSKLSVSNATNFNPGCVSIPAVAGNSVTVNLGPFGGTPPFSVQFSKALAPGGVPGSFASIGSPVVTSTANASYTDATVASLTQYAYKATITDSNATPFSEAVQPALVTTLTTPAFTLSFSPSALTLLQGGTTTTTVTIPAVAGFTGTVTPSAGGLPSGVSASFSPATLTSGTTVCTLTATSGATLGPAPITITGTSGSQTASATGSLAVNPASQVFSSPPSSSTATTYGLYLPAATVGSPSTGIAYLVGGSVLGANLVITPSGSNVTLPGTITIPSGQESATFSYTPTATGTITVASTNNGGLTDPTAATFTATSGSGGGVYPGIADVRNATTYGPTSNLTGTLKVPTPAQVLSGIPTDATTGTVVLPATADVRYAATFGAGSGSTGSLRVPTASQVLATILVDATTGNVVLPTAAQVLSTANFGPNSATAGTIVLPTASQVRAGVTFGPGSATTGTYTATYTAAANVRSGTDRGDGTLGTLVVPTAAQVLAGVTFDATTAGTVVLPIASNVRVGVNYGPGSATTGTFAATGTYTAAANVRSGTDRGDGTLGTLNVPTASQVLATVAVDATTGTVVLPATGTVQTGVTFGPGSSLTGTYAGSGGSGATLAQITTLLASGVTLAPSSLAIVAGAYLVTTGTTSPPTADTWYRAGIYNGLPYYTGTNTGLFAWSSGSNWTISTSLGSAGSASFATVNPTVLGPYTHQGTASGTPSVVAHGNAVLNSFQPDGFDGVATAVTVSTITLSVADPSFAANNAGSAILVAGQFAVILASNTSTGVQTFAAWSGVGSSPTPVAPVGYRLVQVGSIAVGSDPLAGAVPGSYAAGTAGYLIGHNLDATVSSRSTGSGGGSGGSSIPLLVGTVVTGNGTSVSFTGPPSSTIPGDLVGRRVYCTAGSSPYYLTATVATGHTILSSNIHTLTFATPIKTLSQGDSINII